MVEKSSVYRSYNFNNSENILILALIFRVEFSREIIPKMQEAIRNCPKNKKVNNKYFYELLFTTNNLKLVHICCHDKGIHKGRVVNKRRIYVNQ